MKVELSQSSFKRQHASLIIHNDQGIDVPLFKHLDGFGTDITAEVFEFRPLGGVPFTAEYLGLYASKPDTHLLEPGHRAVSAIDLATLYDLPEGVGVLVRYSATHQHTYLLSNWALFRL